MIKIMNKPPRLSELWKKITEHKEHYILMTPYMIIFFLFTVIPVFISLFFSTTYFNILEPPRFIGWGNYVRLFLEDDVFLIALKNTLLLAVITGPISYLMSFVIAWLVNELHPKLRAVMTMFFFAPSIAGNAYLIWQLIFSSDMYGFANAILISLHIINEPVLWLQDPDLILIIIILVQLWMSLGVSFLAFIAGLQGVDKTLYEVAAIDGVKNRWQELWFITLPSMKPQLLFGAVIQITTSFALADVSIQLAGFPSVQYAGHTIVTHLMDYGSIRFEMGYASSIATVLFFIMLMTNLFVQKIIRRVGT